MHNHKAADAQPQSRQSPHDKAAQGDALIAAVAAGIGATVVTRNRPDFERQGASVLTY